MQRPLPCGMAAFLYRCLNTALNVQGWVADDPTEGKAETYEPLTCTACTQVHLVNPKTGKVLGLTKIQAAPAAWLLGTRKGNGTS